MNRTQYPSWLSCQKQRSSLQRECYDEIREALMAQDTHGMHTESIWDE